MDELDDGAIRQDATDETGEVRGERPLSAREQMMEQLAANREEQLHEAVGITPELNEQATPETAEDPAAGQVVRVKIDGEEKELPLSEVVKGFQKDATASKRLEQAAQERQELTEREQTLLEREEQLKRQTTATPAEEAADTGDAEYETALDALLEGDHAPMKALLKKGLEGRPPEATPVTEADLDRVVEQRLQTRQRELDAKTANALFAKDYPDILGDPDLLAAANKRYFAKVNDGMAIGEAMAAAGKETKEWLASIAGKPLSARDEKLQRKSTIDNLPAAGARSASTRDLDNAPENRSQVIAGMRKQRGLV